MRNQWYLKDALEQSPEHAAFRIAPFHDVWEVRVESGETPYTLLHHKSSTGQRGDPLKHDIWRYRTLEDLFEDQEKRDEAVLVNNDWYPVDAETQQRLKSLIGSYSTPGYWPPA